MIPARLWPRSLAFRVVAFSTIWTVLTLLVIMTVIVSLYRQVSERGFEGVLSAHLFNLVGSVGIDAQGSLSGDPDLGDLRFSRQRSGWYWSVEPVGEGLTGLMRSPSMTDQIPSPSVAAVPFDANFKRSYRAEGLAGEEIEVVENEFVMDDKNRVARFRIMGNVTELESEIAGFERKLLAYLALFGGGMIGINAVAILLGLRPLAQVRQALSQIRDGTAQRLDGPFPAEIAPLASETNALIENNRRIMERARTQVGNLAHSLKTPLAVLLNEGRQMGGDKGRLIAEQASVMRDQVEHYLSRARAAAQRDTVVFRAPVQPTLERLARVIGKLNPNLAVEPHWPERPIIFGGEREDLEEIAGNLLENAAKWAAARIRIDLAEDGATDRFELRIEDDGPGIPDERTREALQRGKRLDETKPGTGLGLSIVADLVKEYGGELWLGRSSLGGLAVRVRLRSIA